MLLKEVAMRNVQTERWDAAHCPPSSAVSFGVSRMENIRYFTLMLE